MAGGLLAENKVGVAPSTVMKKFVGLSGLFGSEESVLSFANWSKHANPAHAHRISFSLSDGVRDGLNALVADRNTPQNHVWRARIVL